MSAGSSRYVTACQDAEECLGFYFLVVDEVTRPT